MSKNSAQIRKARQIANSLGTYTAARYLYLRGWSIEGTLWVLTGK